MVKLGRVVGVFGLLLALGAGSALAQKSTTNPYRFWNVCGGNWFNTCAAVDLELIGQSVTMRVWNLSGNPGSDWAATVFTGIGFFNTGNVSPVGPLTMSGGGYGDPGTWSLSEDRQIGGGVRLDLATTTGSNNTSIHNSIASGCANRLLLPRMGRDLWVNPCDDPDWNSDAGWIVFNFDFSGTWNLATTELLVKGQSGLLGLSTQCITGENCHPVPTTEVVPEPITMVLLGSGLAGIAGVNARRRRREDGSDDLA